MLSQCCLQRQHWDNISFWKWFLDCLFVLLFFPFGAQMLSQCCLQRQHWDNISFWKWFLDCLFVLLFFPFGAQMLSQCCLQRQHWDNISFWKWFLDCLFVLLCFFLWCPDVVSMLFAETTLGQHFFLEVVFGLFVCSSVFSPLVPRCCLNVVCRDNIGTTFLFGSGFWIVCLFFCVFSFGAQMLSQCCLQRQHWDNISFWKWFLDCLFVLLFFSFGAQMLFQCCLQRQYSDNIGFWQRYCLFVDFLRCSFLSHLLVSRCCLNIVPMSSLETAFKHHHNSLVFFHRGHFSKEFGKKLSETYVVSMPSQCFKNKLPETEVASMLSQCCLNVVPGNFGTGIRTKLRETDAVSMLSLETTFKQYIVSIHLF